MPSTSVMALLLAGCRQESFRALFRLLAGSGKSRRRGGPRAIRRSGGGVEVVARLDDPARTNSRLASSIDKASVFQNLGSDRHGDGVIDDGWEQR